MSKCAKLELADVEEELGFYLPDRFERPVRQLIESHVEAQPILREPLKTGAKITGTGAGIGAIAGAGIAALARKPKLFGSIIGSLAGATAGGAVALGSKAKAEMGASSDIVARLRRHPEVAPLAEAREQLHHERKVEMLPLLEEQERTKRYNQVMNAFMAGANQMAQAIADTSKKEKKKAK
jgi:hypothetical protein